MRFGFLPIIYFQEALQTLARQKEVSDFAGELDNTFQCGQNTYSTVFASKHDAMELLDKQLATIAVPLHPRKKISPQVAAVMRFPSGNSIDVNVGWAHIFFRILIFFSALPVEAPKPTNSQIPLQPVFILP